MGDSKILCIGFLSRLDFYNIEDNPLYPKFIKSLNNSGSQMIVHLKLDENLLLLQDNNTKQLSVLCVKNNDLTLKKAKS